MWQVAALHGPRVATFEDLRTAAGLVRAAPPTTSGVVKADVPGVVKAGTAIELVSQGFDGTEGPLALPDGSLVFTRKPRGSHPAHRRRRFGLGVFGA